MNNGEFVNLSEERNRIRALQEMLRAIGLATENRSLEIPVTSVFDDNTHNALKIFQREYGLEPNGNYDLITWSKIREIFDFTQFKLASSKYISPYPNKIGYEMRIGERSELVFITQLMLNSLRMYYDLPYVPLNGRYDDVTANAVRQFQRKNNLSETGTVDLKTWERLAEEYNTSVNDNQ